MNTIASIEHQLLLAMPSLNDPMFFQAVVYLCEYNPMGSMGIMINKPTDITLGEILRHLQIKVTDEKVDNYKVVRGGPLGKDQGFIIRRKQDSSEISLSSSKQDLSALAHGQGLDDTLVSLGYAAWNAGQLEQEIASNDWLVVPMDAKILFDVPFKLRWRQAAALIGVDFDKLSGDVGHA
jgi:putative transcriptional regulator